MGHRQIDEHRSAHARVARIKKDRGRRQQRHQLPAGEEHTHVTRREQPGHRQHEPAGQRRHRPTGSGGGDAVARVGQRGHRHHAEHHDEEATQRIEPERRPDVTAKARPDALAANQQHHTGNPEQHHAGRLEPQREGHAPNDAEHDPAKQATGADQRRHDRDTHVG